MKRWALFLLLLNLALFAYLRWGDMPAGGEPERLAAQLKPETIRVLREDELPASQPTPTTEIPASAPEAPASAIAATPAAVATVPACVEWRNLDDAAWQTLRRRLRELGLKTASVKAESDAAGARWWVYIPPLGELPRAQAKAEQLKALGVSDFFVIQDNGRWHTAISLGIFSSQEAAETRLADLQAQGVRSAVARPRDDAPKHWTVRVERLAAPAFATLREFSAGLNGAKFDAVPCG